jgi:hypothetical protein
MRINNQKFYIQLLSLFSLFILLIESLDLSKFSAEGGDDSIVETEGANVEDYNAYLDSQIIRIVPIFATCNKTTTTITTNQEKKKKP